ncbi:MAG: ABC transporter ATP-binding protein [Candidatus Hodarchaeales archaeon]|jgi:ATP-binding cassette subfamily B protein
MSENKDRKSKRTMTDKYLIRRMLPYLFVRKDLISFAFLMIVLSSIIDLAAPYVVSLIIDQYVLIKQKNGLIIIGILYFGLLALSNVTIFFRVWILGMVGQSAIYKMRRDTYEHVQELSMDYFDDVPLGDTMSRLTSDLDQIENILSGTVLTAFSSLLTVAGMFLVLFYFSPLLTVITMLTVPLVIITALLRRKIERPRWLNWRKVRAKNTAVMAEHISGARISLSFAREESNIQEYERVNRDFYESTLRAIRATVILAPVSNTFLAIGSVLVILFGSIIILTQQVTTGLTIGTLFLFITYQGMFLTPISTLTNLYGHVQIAFTSLERIFKLQDRKPSVRDKERAKILECTEGKIEFRNVGFAYKEEKGRVLEGFDLVIQPRETLAIVGETGSGKTTIARLVSRLYEISDGEVLIDDQDIRDVTLESLRKSTGAVLQEPYLYSESIKYNLTYSKNATDEELLRVTSIIGATFIYDLPEGLDTLVGERGSRLSMGQRQLISFARALVADPEILILDEATSSVDQKSEQQIQKALKKMLKNRTSIIIAHRLSTVRDADRIIVLDKGKLVEDGTFNELMEKKGQFHELYSILLQERARASSDRN